MKEENNKEEKEKENNNKKNMKLSALCLKPLFL